MGLGITLVSLALICLLSGAAGLIFETAYAAAELTVAGAGIFIT
jgi:hypothetical protein